MKKTRLCRIMACVLAVSMIFAAAACGSSGSSASSSSSSGSSSSSSGSTEASANTGAVDIDSLTIAFVPSRDPDEIVTVTEPLKDLLTDELAGLGYNVAKVEITVGTTYEAVGEGLDAGSIDIGFGMPGGTYVLYDDACDVILTSTRDGLSKDSDNPADWNDGEPTLGTEAQAVSYRALIIAGPSDKGQALAAKVNAGEELTWEDLDNVSWSVMNTSSSAGYIYPALWLEDKYGKSIPDLSSTVISDSYASAFARLASGQVDVLATFADARRDYEENWNNEYGRTESIWAETNVVGVTDPIYNDTITVSRNSDVMDDDLVAALQQAFINIASTDEGKEVIAIYSHTGYKEAESSDYDSERSAQKLLQELSAN